MTREPKVNTITENIPGIDASACDIVSPVIVLGNQADEGNDNAPVRRVESTRRLDGRQIVVEVARADGKELGKESESIALEGLESHWDDWEKAAERRRDGETDRGMKDEMMGMRANIIEGMQTCIQSNVEPERKLVVIVVAVIWREGEATRQKAGCSILGENGLISLISE
jgi:hypothetical protein